MKRLLISCLTLLLVGCAPNPTAHEKYLAYTDGLKVGDDFSVNPHYAITIESNTEFTKFKISDYRQGTPSKIYITIKKRKIVAIWRGGTFRD